MGHFKYERKMMKKQSGKDSEKAPKKEPEKPNTEEIEQKIKEAERHKELTSKISETIGKLLDKEGVETAVFCCTTDAGPVIFWRGELLKAAKAASLVRAMLIQQINNEIN
jgi:hypothetical protein